jgi:hypothetical protein
MVMLVGVAGSVAVHVLAVQGSCETPLMSMPRALPPRTIAGLCAVMAMEPTRSNPVRLAVDTRVSWLPDRLAVMPDGRVIGRTVKASPWTWRVMVVVPPARGREMRSGPTSEAMIAPLARLASAEGFVAARCRAAERSKSLKISGASATVIPGSRLCNADSSGCRVAEFAQESAETAQITAGKSTRAQMSLVFMMVPTVDCLENNPAARCSGRGSAE